MDDIIRPDRVERFTRFIEPRAESDENERPHITGYVTVFDAQSDLIWDFHETIARDAFTESLSDDAQARKSYFNHDANWILGNSENDTATFREDDKGIYLDAIPPKTHLADDAIVYVRDGYVNHSSFAFSVIEEEWSGTVEDPMRRILKGTFYEGGPVSDAVYPQTTTAVRSLYRGLGVDLSRVKPAVAKYHLDLDLTVDEKDIVKRTMDILGRAVDIEIGETEDDVKGSRSNIVKLKLQIALVRAKMD